MWYVVQVIGGQEDAAVSKIQNRQVTKRSKPFSFPNTKFANAISGLGKPEGKSFSQGTYS